MNRLYQEQKLPYNLTFFDLSRGSNGILRGNMLLDGPSFADRSEGTGESPLLASLEVGVKARVAVADRLYPDNGETPVPMVPVLLRI